MQSILHSYFIHRIFRSPFHGHTKLSLVTNVNAKYPWSGKALGMISWDYATLQNSDHIQTEISVYFFLRLSGMDCFIPLTSSSYCFLLLLFFLSWSFKWPFDGLWVKDCLSHYCAISTRKENFLRKPQIHSGLGRSRTHWEWAQK